MCYRCERGYLEILRFFDSLLNTLTEKLGQEIAKIQAVIAVEFLSEFERLFEEKYPLKRIRGGVTAVEEDHERKKRKIEETKAEAARKEAEKNQRESALLEKIDQEMSSLGVGTNKKEKEKIEKRKALLTFVQSVIKGEQSKITEDAITRIADSICGLPKEKIEDLQIYAARAILDIKKKDNKWLNKNDRRKNLQIKANMKIKSN